MVGRIPGASLAALRLEARLERSAHNTANVNTPGFDPERGEPRPLESAGGASAVAPPVKLAETGLSNVDLAVETVERIASLQGFKANLAVVRTADEVTQGLLNIKA